MWKKDLFPPVAQLKLIKDNALRTPLGFANEQKLRQMNNWNKKGRKNRFINIKNCSHICMGNTAPAHFFIPPSHLGAVFNLVGAFFS